MARTGKAETYESVEGKAKKDTHKNMRSDPPAVTWWLSLAQEWSKGDVHGPGRSSCAQWEEEKAAQGQLKNRNN